MYSSRGRPIYPDALVNVHNTRTAINPVPEIRNCCN